MAGHDCVHIKTQMRREPAQKTGRSLGVELMDGHRSDENMPACGEGQVRTWAAARFRVRRLGRYGGQAVSESALTLPLNVDRWRRTGRRKGAIAKRRSLDSIALELRMLCEACSFTVLQTRFHDCLHTHSLTTLYSRTMAVSQRICTVAFSYIHVLPASRTTDAREVREGLTQQERSCVG